MVSRSQEERTENARHVLERSIRYRTPPVVIARRPGTAPWRIKRQRGWNPRRSLVSVKGAEGGNVEVGGRDVRTGQGGFAEFSESAGQLASGDPVDGLLKIGG